MQNNPRCSQIQRELRLRQSSISAPALAHCRDCLSCSEQLATLRSLEQALQVYADTTAKEVQDIDLSASLMSKLADSKQSSLWPRRLAFAAAAGFALCVFFVVRWQSSTPFPIVASIHAEDGVLVRYKDRSHKVAGQGLPSFLPFSISTQHGQRASIVLGQDEFSVPGKSKVEILSPNHIALASGGLSVQSSSALRITPSSVPGTALLVHGRVSIETKDQSPMKLLKRHKTIAASAVLVIAVYSGWTVLKSKSGDERIEASKGAYVDSEGKTHLFDLEGEDDNAIAKANVNLEEGLTGRAGESAAFAPAGAFWDEDKAVVQFRIRGEVFDADSGETLDGFHLQAELLDSKDFGQTIGKGVSKTYSNLSEGNFVLEGIGLGTWRITASREGFAPVTQRLDISDLQATPYLVIPLSGGATLSGRVVDWRGQVVAGASIGMKGCKADDGDNKDLGCNLTKSDSSGNFVLEKLPEDETYSISASHKKYGYATSRNLRSSIEGSGQHITIALSGRVRIYGHVSKGENETPVVGAVVVGEDGSTKTDSAGNYELTIPLDEGPEVHILSYPGSSSTHNIQSYPDDRSVRRLQWVDADSHAAEVEINFRLQMSSASLFGQILDTEGKPRADVTIGLVNTNGWKRKRGHQTFPTEATTDARGNYRVENIPSEAGYQVRYREHEDEEWQRLGYVNIPDESEVRANFRLGSASVRGIFVSSDNGEQIAVSQSDCSRFGAENSLTKGVFVLAHCFPDGRFEFQGLAAGDYLLHSKVTWKSDSVQFVDSKIKLTPSQRLTDLRMEVKGQGAVSWRFRILDAKGTFLSGPYIRYQVANTNNTANLHVQDDGVATIQLSKDIKDIFIEVPGYEPGAIDLSTKVSADVVDVRLSKSKGD